MLYYTFIKSRESSGALLFISLNIRVERTLKQEYPWKQNPQLHSAYIYIDLIVSVSYLLSCFQIVSALN
jgi:hypothetical protein